MSEQNEPKIEQTKTVELTNSELRLILSALGTIFDRATATTDEDEKEVIDLEKKIRDLLK